MWNTICSIISIGRYKKSKGMSLLKLMGHDSPPIESENELWVTLAFAVLQRQTSLEFGERDEGAYFSDYTISLCANFVWYGAQQNVNLVFVPYCPIVHSITDGSWIPTVAPYVASYLIVNIRIPASSITFKITLMCHSFLLFLPLSNDTTFLCRECKEKAYRLSRQTNIEKICFQYLG